MAHMQDHCPCCGRKMPEDSEMRWDLDSRSLSLRGVVLRLSPLRSRIFDALWRARGKRVISHQQMMEYVYADDPEGGPESTNIISVQVNHLKKALAPFGLTVSGYAGYSLLELPAGRVAA